MNRQLVLLVAVWVFMLLPGPTLAQSGDASLLDSPYASIEAQARGSQVRWYMFGGWAHVNGDGLRPDSKLPRAA